MKFVISDVIVLKNILKAIITVLFVNSINWSNVEGCQRNPGSTCSLALPFPFNTFLFPIRIKKVLVHEACKVFP